MDMVELDSIYINLLVSGVHLYMYNVRPPIYKLGYEPQ